MNDFLAMFPPKLAKRLRRAGVTDPLSLEQVMSHDKALASAVNHFLDENPEVAFLLTMGALLEAFASTETPDDLLQFWDTLPAEARALFIPTVTTLADEMEMMGEEDEAVYLRQKLSALWEALKAAQPPLVVALAEFLDARDVAAARRVYGRNRALLSTPTALAAIQKFQVSDPVMEAHRDQRRDLLSALQVGELPPAARPAPGGRHGW